MCQSKVEPEVTTQRGGVPCPTFGFKHFEFKICINVTSAEAINLLEKFRAGGVGRDKVLQAFQAAPAVDLGFAQVDTHRALRKGFPEVIFGSGKSPDQVLKIG